jgi:hypothetical protein
MINFDLTTINFIPSSQNIDESITTINANYKTLQSYVSALQIYYDNNIQPIIEYYNQYSSQLNDTLTLTQNYSANWDDFQTIVQSNSSKWLRPFTIFYPTLIQNNINQDDINTIIIWLNEYFPIINIDGNLNYTQNQSIIVSCYLYSYDTDNQINTKEYAYSYSKCSTSNGIIHAHCQTIVTGGWVNCNQGSYLCDTVLDCYPSLKVSCWYGDPYLYNYGNIGLIIPPENPPPTTPNSIFQSYVNNRSIVRGQILADISMNYLDKKENGIQSLKFIVNNCEWSYVGNI